MAEQKNKNILIIFAHQEHKSFNGALLDSAVKVFKAAGHSVEVSDLYAMKFEAVATRADIDGDLENPDFFKYQMETGTATAKGKLSADIKAEQAKLTKADLVLFMFPLYWFSTPAILKGWFDRVMSVGFAYGGDKGYYHPGGMAGKKAMLSVTTGGPESMCSPTGISGAMEVNLWHINNGWLRFCGFEVLEPNLVFGPAHLSEDVRKDILVKWEQRCKELFAEKPYEFQPLSDFDFTTFKLKPDVKPVVAAQGAVAKSIGKRFP